MTETNKSSWFLIFSLILLTVGFRIVHLQADPPADFSWSGGDFADEGFWSHNARNEVLFGEAVQDGWDARIVSPVFARLQTLSFRLFGAGLIQVRLIGVLSSILITLACFFIVRREFEERVAFGAAALVSLNYPMLVLGRQGLLEPFAAALLCVSIVLLFVRNPYTFFLSGVLFAATCFTKFLMAYALVPVLFLLLKPSKRSIGFFFTGAVLTAAVWLFTNYLPHRDLLEGYNRYYASQQNWGAGSIARNVVTQPFYLYFSKTPAVLFFGNLMLWQLFSTWKEQGVITRLFWIWLLTGIVFFAIWGYRPFRYYSSLVIPLAALAALALRCNIRLRPLTWIGLLAPCAQLAFVLADQLLGWQIVPKQLGLKSLDIFVFLALTIAFVLIQRKPAWIMAAFVVSFLICDMRTYLQWVLKPEYAALEISHDLEARVGDGTITGQWAPELSLENRMKVVPVWPGFVNDDQPFEKYGISHVLVWKYPLGGEKFDQWYPEEFHQFEPVVTYRIKDSDLVLYERETVRQTSWK